MTTIDDSLALQQTDNVLTAPEIPAPLHDVKLKTMTALANPLSIKLFNSTTSSNVYAYITGLALNNNSAVMLLQSDGHTPYYPASPSSNGAALSADCGIKLGAPGTSRTVTIPLMAGGRIWFGVGSTLSFFLNTGSNGPGLVEPSVSNPSDANYHLTWDFCEFTYNSSQLYANITYVDFVCLPIAMTLTSTSGSTSHVGGLPVNGLDTICKGLIAQNNVDKAGWDQLVIKNNGANLRALAPIKGMVFNSSLFATYWNSYIDAVWAKYVSSPLTIDTQVQWGQVSGNTSNDRTHLVFPAGSFPKPTSTDIFGANSGAFAPQANNTAELLNIGARLDAAFNRSTLLINDHQPANENVSTYYKNAITNHYARIVHAANVDGRGYCYPYDDVAGNNGGADQSGFVADGSPASLLITVGGTNAFAKRDVQTPPVQDGKMMKRSLNWIDSEPVAQLDENRDLEGGVHSKLLNEFEFDAPSPVRGVTLPPVLERWVGPQLAVSHLPSPSYIPTNEDRNSKPHPSTRTACSLSWQSSAN